MISLHQYGFQKGRSTEQAVSALTESIYSALNSKEITLTVFVDLSKAFDTVSHQILLNKLELYGFRGLPLKLLCCYSSDRSQVTKIINSFSSPKPMTIGVPQGSHLRPLLFLLFINDLPNISDLFCPLLFADDLTVCFSGKNTNNLVETCSSEIDKLASWSRSNRLTIN